MPRNDIVHRLKTQVSPLLSWPAINRLRGVPMPSVTGNNAQIAIARMIVEGGNLVARVGSTEGRATAFFLSRRLAETGARPDYEARTIYEMKAHSGYFPIDGPSLDAFGALYLRTIAAIDLYAAWTPFDKILRLPGTPTTRLRDLDPFFTRQKWTMALAGRRVVVVNPFGATMAAQWRKRTELFAVETLPACDMQFVIAPQTHGNAIVAGADWSDNLARLDEAVEATGADTAIIGAGAYGLPLGAMAKRRGLTAVVLGGSTQLLFGIMGNRWMLFPEYRALLNPSWTRPDVNERPAGYAEVEDRWRGVLVSGTLKIHCVEDRRRPFIEVFRSTAVEAGYDVVLGPPSADYCPAFQAFARHYVHLSSNSPEFELACFRRFFEVARVVAPDERAILSDSDIVVQAQPTELPAEILDFTAAGAGGGISASIGMLDGVAEFDASPHFSFWTGARLREFCDYLVATYSENSNRLRSLYERKRAAGAPYAAISDMTLIRLWSDDCGVPLCNSNRLVEGSYLDHNISTPDAANVTFRTMLGRKAIRIRRDGVWFTTAAGAPVKPSTIHLQGRYKIIATSLRRRSAPGVLLGSSYVAVGRAARAAARVIR